MMTDFEVLFCGRDFYVVDKGEDDMESFKIIGYDKSNGEDHSAVCLLNVNGEIEVFTSKPVKFGNESCPYKPVKSRQEQIINDAYARLSSDDVWGLYERVEPEKPVKLSNELKLREYEKLYGVSEPANPALPPLPAGATRHKALPQACLTLPDAAAFMKGMQ